MTATVAEVTVPATDFALAATFAEFGDVRFEGERVAAQDDQVVALLWVTHDDIETIHEAFDADPTTANVEVLADLEGERLYRMEWTERIDTLVYALIEEGGAVLSAAGRNGTWLFRLLFSDRESLRRTHDHCADTDFDLTVERMFDLNNGRQGQYGLSDKQHEVLRSAFEHGYYSIPRETNAKALADEIGVSHQALSERLRRAHGTLAANTVMLGRNDERHNSDGTN